ncbi:MAG: plastocyanin [Polaribacter sp.]|jgi:plastocyanin
MKKPLTIALFWLFCNSINAQLIINEVFYNSPGGGADPLEFIEIYNNAPFPVMVNGYTITDAINYQFPDTVIQAGDFYVIAKDSLFMSDSFGIASQQWNLGDNLANGEDIIILRDMLGAVLDSVAYTDSCPWPEDADGDGHSMELCTASQDNNIGSNWLAAETETPIIIDGDEIFATPGTANTVCSPLANQLVITEIMYNPPESGNDTTEFIEIYNAGTEPIELDGLVMSGGIDFIFPDEEMDEGDYILLAFDADALRGTYNIPNSVEIYQWDASEELSNAEEQRMIIRDASGYKVDEVYYDQSLVYHEEKVDGVGGGHSLELCDVQANNLQPMSWKPSQHYTGVVTSNTEVFCTPAAANSLYCTTADHVIMITDDGFVPNNIDILAGQIVLWINNTTTEHNIDGTGNFPAFMSGEADCGPWSYCFIFDVPGDYGYTSDGLGSSMAGNIDVDEPPYGDIVITEILYHQPGGDNNYDFVEFYNRSESIIELGEYEFTDGVVFDFDNIAMDPGEYLVITKDAEAFTDAFGIDAFEWTNGGLDNNSETITLSNGTAIVDKVTFNDNAPWPEIADGEGASIMLCTPESDNANPLNWRFSTTQTSVATSANPNLYIHATPGAANDSCSSLPSIFFGEDIPVFVLEDADTVIVKFKMANLNTTEEAFVDVVVDPSSTAMLGTDFFIPEMFVDFEPDGFGTTTIGRLTVIIVDDTEQEFTEKIVIRLENPVNATLATTGTASIDIIDNDGFNPGLYPEMEIGAVTTVDTEGVNPSNGTITALTGIVYGNNIHPDGVEFTLIDQDDKEDGIRVFKFDNAPDYTVQEGDEVIVYGVITQFDGLTQIIPDNIVKLSEGNTLHAPDSISAVAFGEMEESKLIAIKGCVVIDDNQNVGPARHYFIISEDTNMTYLMRVDDDTDVPETIDLPDMFIVTGIGSQIDPGTAPYNAGYMIMPRYAADVVETEACEVTSTSNLEDLRIKVFPNPATNQLFINTDVALEELVVYNMLGQRVISKSVDQMENTLDIEKLTPGCYFLTCIHQDKMRTVKFVKE